MPTPQTSTAEVLPEAELERVLVLVAHPDDAEFWAAGSIASWARAGARVVYGVLTDGDSGGSDPSMSAQQVVRKRRDEQRQAAAVLGVEDVHFFGRREDELVPDDDLRREIVRLIRAVRPQRVITWSPEWNWNRFRTSSHPNHRMTGEIVLTAVYPYGENPRAYPELLDEGLTPWAPREVWLLNNTSPNHIIDVTGLFEIKLEAIRAHASQVGHREGLADEVRERMRPANLGLDERVAPDRLVEAFTVVLNR